MNGAARRPLRLYLDTSAYLAVLLTALWFHRHEAIDRFVTMDGSQRQAAKELGLPV